MGLRHRARWLAALVLGVALLVAACGGSGAGGDMNPREVVAVVDGTEITAGRLYQAMVAEYGQRALDNLITQVLIENEAKKAGVSVSDAEIDQRFDEVAEDYGGRETFEMLLEQSGFSVDSVRNELYMDLLVKKILAPTVDVSDEAVAAYYEENQDRFAVPDRVHTRHILTETEEEAREVLQRLQDGEDFAAVAAEVSTDPSAAANDGDIGWQERGALVDEYFDAAFAAEPGQIIGPVESIFGFHVIELIAKEEGRSPDFEEVQEDVREALLDEKVGEAMGPWLMELHGNAEIDNRLR
ncbi:MAG TPA: peptidyl-prolyl cis-trans isomerase [Sphingobacteriaceae bacterium]|nr:peptidyl-prolyl cis-trans isomerase [Sphingobacteriaceae bacterium]